MRSFLAIDDRYRTQVIRKQMKLRAAIKRSVLWRNDNEHLTFDRKVELVALLVA